MKYRFEGIGEASAVATMTALAGSPFSFLAAGALGSLVFFLLKLFYMWLASAGLVVLNIGVAKLITLSEQAEFDGSFDEAFRLIKEKGGKLTEDEKRRIDAKVIAAFRKFGTFGVRAG